MIHKSTVNECIAQEANDEIEHNDINDENVPKVNDAILKGLSGVNRKKIENPLLTQENPSCINEFMHKI